MRRSTLVALLLTATIPATVAAQRADSAHATLGRTSTPYIGQTFSTNPIALPFGFISGEYERAFGRTGFAVGLGGFTNLGSGSGSILDRGETYRAVQAKLKYYPREDGLRGFAVGVTAGIAHARSTAYSYSAYGADGQLLDFSATYNTQTSPTVGATLDYNFLIGRRRRFLVGLGVGVKRVIGGSEDNHGIGARALDRALVDPRLQIGFGF